MMRGIAAYFKIYFIIGASLFDVISRGSLSTLLLAAHATISIRLYHAKRRRFCYFAWRRGHLLTPTALYFYRAMPVSFDDCTQEPSPARLDSRDVYIAAGRLSARRSTFSMPGMTRCAACACTFIDDLRRISRVSPMIERLMRVRGIIPHVAGLTK